MFGSEHTPHPHPTRLSALSNWRGRGADGCDERPVFDECVFQLAGERSARGDDELRQAGREGAELSESQEGTAGESPGGRKEGRKAGKRGEIKLRGTLPGQKGALSKRQEEEEEEGGEGEEDALGEYLFLRLTLRWGAAGGR